MVSTLKKRICIETSVPAAEEALTSRGEDGAMAGE